MHFLYYIIFSQKITRMENRARKKALDSTSVQESNKDVWWVSIPTIIFCKIITLLVLKYLGWWSFFVNVYKWLQWSINVLKFQNSLSIIFFLDTTINIFIEIDITLSKYIYDW